MALTLGTIVMMFSYFPFAAAFATEPGAPPRIDPGLIAIALVVAPFVFVVIGIVSRNRNFPNRVLKAMGLLLLFGFGVGLLSPALGATAGFGVGGALTLRQPEAYGVFRWRMWAVALAVFYTFVLLVVATPAGVFTGGLLPLMMLGFADEYCVWRNDRDPQTA